MYWIRREIVHYLDNRQEKGFTVIQAVILSELDGLDKPNAYGYLPLVDKDPTQITEGYFGVGGFCDSRASANEECI